MRHQQVIGSCRQKLFKGSIAMVIPIPALKKQYLITWLLVVITGIFWIWAGLVNSQSFRQDGNKTVLIDQYGETWDISQAVTLGFDPRYFQYGIGRNTIRPVDDSHLESSKAPLFDSARVIGVKKKDESHAYVVSKLSLHEIANTTIGGEPVTVGY